MKIENWCESNKLNYSYLKNNNHLIKVEERTFIIIEPKNGVLFDDDFELIVNTVDFSLASENHIENYLFDFGGNWYYTPIDKKEVELIPFKYIGKAKLQDDFEFPYLGVHGKYDLCNGSRDYKDWIKKAKFLGINTLGLCETNTLAGTLPFQLACKEFGVKCIIGEEVSVRNINTNEEFFVKLYVINNEGWDNLLLINTEINVHNSEERYIDIVKLIDLSKGLICVTSNLSLKNIKTLKRFFKHFYFQIDPVEYLSDEKDKEHLLNLKDYVDNYIGEIKPVIICDSYYLDQEDAEIRHILNKIGKTNYYNQSHDQYFKSTDEMFSQMVPLFKEDDSRLDDLINNSLENLSIIENLCVFSLDTSLLHLPQYEMTLNESKLFETKEDLFWGLIQKEFEKKIEGKVKNEDIYWDRIEKEVSVIEKGGFIDYFLILWDIVNWCDAQNILTGVGRGSAAGSLVAYLLGLVKVDPIKYDLLFERFLNESRINSSAPDIDLDFEGNRRGDVKEYIEQRYGVTCVTSIGTYSTLKMRAAIKDLGRLKNIPPQITNYFTSMIDPESSFTELFRKAASTPRLKQFIKENTELINLIPQCFEQPKTQSIHAAGVVIIPKLDNNGVNRDIYSWMPVRKVGDSLVSEWEGSYIDKAGFLKCDILGIRQLEKFKNILSLIKINTNKDIILEDIPLNQEPVYDLFRVGLTEDVFQFGAAGLKGYCQVLRPDNIEDLIATVALYRPGPIEIGAHAKYAKIKNGESYPEYSPGTKEITQSTYSNIVYQEQVMAICSKIGGFSLVEADDVRRAMGKKNIAEMEKYQVKFVDSAIKIGYSRIEATQLWNNLESFASYAFNRCISGEEVIYRASINTKAFHPTISDMYKIKNDYNYAKKTRHNSLHWKYKLKGYGHSFSLNSENRLVKNNIIDIRFVGGKEIFRVTTELGKTIDVTMNHKFPTNNGEKELKNIDIKKDLLFINKGFIPYDTASRYGKDENHNYPTKGTQGFQKKDNTNFIKWRSLKKESRKKTHCDLCEKLSSRIEMHHKDGDHNNNEENNTIDLCPSCHKKEEYKLGRKKMGEAGLHTSFEKIISIKFLKIDEVYDIEMEDPYHTFTTVSGIVTSNSHATCYAMTGYYCQWFKYNYPLEFWTTALIYSKDDELPSRINEIYKTSKIKLLPPDVNYSQPEFNGDVKSNKIYWSLNSVKFISEKASEAILMEREVGGDFLSIEDFKGRVNKRVVNKRVIFNLILCGAFDQLYDIPLEEPEKRFDLIKDFCASNKEDVPGDYNQDTIWKSYFFTLKQKQLCGLGWIDFEKIYKSTNMNYPIINEAYIFSENARGNGKCIGGVVSEVLERNSKKGPFAQIILDCNNQMVTCIMWAEIWPEYKEQITNSVDKILFISGEIKFDTYRQANVLQTNKTTKIVII